MSDRTVLPKSSLSVSRIGLGLAAFHLMENARRRQLIKTALEVGITHFDTARFYGDGESERSLGKILGAKRRSLTVTTKFGLLPTPVIASLGVAAPAARKGRSLLSKLKLVDYPRRSYTRSAMQKSLRDSLKALATDYIDVYCLHEPLADFVPADDVIDDLLREKAKGTIKYLGVSGDQIDQVVNRFGAVLDVIQCAEWAWSADRYVPDITYSVFTRNLAEKKKAPVIAPRTLLEEALARRETGAVIVQTRRPEHLREVMSWAARN